jgi:hypothetical protein
MVENRRLSKYCKFPKRQISSKWINHKNHGIILLYGGMDIKDNNLYIIVKSIIKEIGRKNKNYEIL